MRPPLFELRPPRDAGEWARYHEIRKTALFDVYHPWIPYDPDHPDERRPANHPLVFLKNGKIIGTIRIDVNANATAIFRMVAIDSAERGRSAGGHMLELAESYALRWGVGTLYLNSVAPAFGFYRRHGFKPHRWRGCTSCPTSIPVAKPLTMEKTLRRAA